MYCPYCAQSDTKKDPYGYCKKYNCFIISSTKDKLDSYILDLRKANDLPKYKRNQFDGIPWNPRQVEISWVYKKIQALIGFVPLDAIARYGRQSLIPRPYMVY